MVAFCVTWLLSGSGDGEIVILYALRRLSSGFAGGAARVRFYPGLPWPAAAGGDRWGCPLNLFLVPHN